MKIASKVSKLLIASLMLLAAIGSTIALPNALAAPTMSRADSTIKATSSTNWSGYAVTGATGSVTSANGSWTIPTMTAGASSSTTYYSAFWVGIDGYSSSTVEQVGTLSITQGKTVTMYAWFEFYPNPMYEINGFTIKAGDNMYASVNYLGASTSKFNHKATGSIFSVTITDETTGQTYTTQTTVNSAARSSAEWIAEAPSSNRGILPLANFGTVKYGADNTQVVGTCYATINGVNQPLGSFSSATPITMVTSSGAIKAAPSLALSSDGTSFSVTWENAGP